MMSGVPPFYVASRNSSPLQWLYTEQSQEDNVVLSDRTIKEELASGRIVITPLDPLDIQPASVDLHLDRNLLKFKPLKDFSFIDVHEHLEDLTEPIEIQDPFPYILQPDEFILASTLEYVGLADDIVARLEGKSSLGRLGLLIHSTAGYVDPGWKGTLTLEISNVAKYPITLYYRMKISQISFLRLTTTAERPYGSEELGSKYQGQIGPTATRLHRDFPASRNGKARPYTAGETKLKQWLESSRFTGNLKEFASALEVPLKTVEDWVYGRSTPNAKNRKRLFSLTQLPEYDTKAVGEQSELLPAIDP